MPGILAKKKKKTHLRERLLGMGTWETFNIARKGRIVPERVEAVTRLSEEKTCLPDSEGKKKEEPGMALLTGEGWRGSLRNVRKRPGPVATTT